MIVRRAHALYATAAGDDGALVQRYATSIDRLARRIALRVGDPSLFDDLWSAGAIGLIDAARRFDAGLGLRFESFAEHRIRGAMLDELRRLDHLPRRLRNDLDRVAASRKRLAQELCRDPEPEELAADLGIELETLAELEALQQPLVPIPEDLPFAAADIPADEALEAHERQAQLTSAIASLPERLQLLLQLHYVEGLTYKEIAKLLEVSEPRICQLHREAVKRMQAFMADA